MASLHSPRRLTVRYSLLSGDKTFRYRSLDFWLLRTCGLGCTLHLVHLPVHLAAHLAAHLAVEDMLWLEQEHELVPGKQYS